MMGSFPGTTCNTAEDAADDEDDAKPVHATTAHAFTLSTASVAFE